MGLYIGSLDLNNPTLPQYVKDINLANYKIYGVTFSGNTNTGTRIFNANGLSWTPSSESIAGVDDFYSIQDSSFRTRKCIMQYNSSTGDHTYTFKDEDPELYASLLTNKTGVRMVAYPKFYYKRPDEWTFLVSSSPVPGFTISPMHYRRSVLGGTPRELDYMYVGEFMINENNQMSQPGYKPKVNQTMDQFRALAKANGGYIEDYSTYSMIRMLAIIKYANLNSQDAVGMGVNIGDAIQVMTDVCSNIKGEDGYRSSLSANANIKVMGLCDLFANAWEFQEGIFTYGSDTYINNDIETIEGYPSMSNWSEKGWTKLSTGLPNSSVSNASYSNLYYNSDYPYFTCPKTGRSVNPIGDNYWHATPQDVVLVGGGGWDGLSDGLFCWYSISPLSHTTVYSGARFVCL